VFYGRGEIKILPDSANVNFFVNGQASSPIDADIALDANLSRVTDALRSAGMPLPEREHTPDGGKANRLPGDGAPRYSVMVLEFVPVRDFTLLEKITKILIAQGFPDWYVYYPISDVDALETQAGAAATDDAARQAHDYAVAHGFREAQPASPPSVYICLYSAGPTPQFLRNPACHKQISDDQGEGGTEEIVVTARRREGPRTDFSIPKPVERKMTATVAAAFTFN
jgi:hypothetical protein